MSRMTGDAKLRRDLAAATPTNILLPLVRDKARGQSGIPFRPQRQGKGKRKKETHTDICRSTASKAKGSLMNGDGQLC